MLENNQSWDHFLDALMSWQNLLNLCFQNEVSLKGYKAHLSGVNAPAPLTNREEALKELQDSEVTTNYGTDSRWVGLYI